MDGQILTDIDMLCLSVRDRESRRLILEAITAYRGGALRSAIMSIWIAVAYDIISKARELASQGEAAPQSFIVELDSAIEKQDLRKLQSIETNLLRTAHNKLQLFAPHEFDALERLQKDRNLCAHPAFVYDGMLYQPTPEVVRAHLVHALRYLLIHAPLQGKSAILKFEADILSHSFPSSSEDIGSYIRSKYLDRAKKVLVTNLIKGLLKSLFGAERKKFIGKERLLAKILREISIAKTEIYDDITPGFVALKFETVPDDSLLGICSFLEADTRLWNWVTESVRLRIKTLLKKSDLGTLKEFRSFDAFSIPELADLLMGRFYEFDKTTQINVIGENPRVEFVKPAIELYSKAGGWRQAEMLGQTLILGLAHFLKAEDIQKILEVVANNMQILEASGMPTIMAALFDLTRNLLNNTRPYWTKFVQSMTEQQQGDETAYYAYPEIREKLNNP